MTPANKGALERIAAALERIADNMDAAKVLEERRRKKAARQARYRASRNAVASTVDAAERNEEAKEGKSPHTPLLWEQKSIANRVRLPISLDASVHRRLSANVARFLASQ